MEVHKLQQLTTAYFPRQGLAVPYVKVVAGASSLGMNQAKPFKLLFVEMGVGYDQHGQDITAAAVRACKNAISSNSIPAFRTGAIPGVSWQEMKLKLKLGVPKSAQHELDIEKVKAVFP
ncbi:hypothetical protein KP509_1Z269300 [Ceratopteris richardii]|nr:hypothetical protein KP509_1Z269300 [Ceratopteris richardii]